jgi:ABC-2 type transport system permease protein
LYPERVSEATTSRSVRPGSARWNADLAYVGRVVRVVSVADFKLKYAESSLGYVWSIAKPLAYFAVLYVVFGRFFRLNTGFVHYPVYLLIGIVLWTFFLDTTNIALWSFVGNTGLLKKLAFPRIVLPISVSMTTLLTFAVNLIVLMVLVGIAGLRPRLTWLLVPGLLFELYLFTLAVSVVLATLLARMRDIGQVWEVAGQLLFYASPIIYPVGFLPHWAQVIAFANPFVQVMQDMRAAFVPQPESMTIAHVYGTDVARIVPLITLAVMLTLAWKVFRRAEPYLAELT